MRDVLRATALPAVIGGAVVAVAFLLVGPVKEKTTTIERSSASDASPAAPIANPTQGLTAHEIYQQAAPGVVFVRSEIVQTTENPFDVFPQRQRSEATGSGFVIDSTGRILTNYHVIQGAQSVTVSFEDNKTARATVIGKDQSDDLALLKVDPSGLDLHPLRLGSSKTVEVGDPTLAIGNPFGYDRTLTSGIVSALQRQITAPNGFAINNVMQTDAAINPGNSGGPLLDSQGRVIGINSQIATGGSSGAGDTGGNLGIGFAVPVDTARKVLPQLEKTGTVKQAWMGIQGLTIDGSLAGLGIAAKSGVLLQTVTGPAAKAGLRGGQSTGSVAGQSIRLGGDVITDIDGHAITTMDGLVNHVEAKNPGDKMTVTYLRGGKAHTTTLTLGTRPANLSAAR
jgi:S1-C subfamily serine protease